MKELTQGAKCIFNSDEFTITRFKDRFSKGKETSGGWRDAMITGYFEDDKFRHQVEIQLHLNCLLKLRSMGGSVGGGHRLYATYRSLEEALKVAYGHHKVTETIEKHRQTSPHPRPLPKRPPPKRERTPPKRERTPPRRGTPPPRKSRDNQKSNPRKKSIDIASPDLSVTASAPPV